MVGIVILNYNNAHLTIDCIESICRYNTYPIRIAVVDNASEDDSISVLRNFLRCHGNVFELLESNRNGGYAQGNNIGLRHFEMLEEVSEVMILNNDILFTENIVPKLVEFLNTHLEAGLASPLLKKRDGKTIDNSCARKDCKLSEIIWSYLLYFTDIFGIISHYRKLSKIQIDLTKSFQQIELPSGSCMMIKKELFKKVDYFDPNTFLYYEENILYRKMLLEGKTNYLLPGVSCIHLGGETTNKISHPAEYMKTSKASALYYAKNYARPSLLQKLLLTASYRWFNTCVTIVKFLKNGCV